MRNVGRQAQGIQRTSRLGLSRPLVVFIGAALVLGVGGSLPSPSIAAPQATRAHIVVAFQPGVTLPNAGWSALTSRYGLSNPKPVFRGHPDWGIIDWSLTAPAVAIDDAVKVLNQAPGVLWAEIDQALTITDKPAGKVAPATASSQPAPQPAPASNPLATHRQVSTNPGQRSSQPIAAAADPMTPSAPAQPRLASMVAPPTGCAARGGVNAGQPNDPLYCNEPAVPAPGGPFYSEQWDNFCFTPTTQSATVTAAAPAPPAASGICADGAWANGYQGQGTIIAILDSGIDYFHPDLVNQMVNETNDPLLNDASFPGTASDGHKHGWNFYDDTSEPMDYYGHGTGRAGIAAAEADNGMGVAGVAPKAHLMAVKVGDTYVVHSENLAEGAVYAADHGADVINTSLGATGASKTLATAALYVAGKGVVWAAATANEYSDHHNFPNTDTTVLGIAGVGPDNAANAAETCTLAANGTPSSCAPENGTQHTFVQKVNYANFGGGVAFAAPIDTPSTVASIEYLGCHKDPLVLPPTGCKGQGGYSLHNSGTSTSTPHAAGAAAVVRSAGLLSGLCQGHLTLGATFPTCTGAPLSSNEVRQLMIYTATRVHNSDTTTANYPASAGVPFTSGPYYPAINPDPHTGWNQWYGYGRPNVFAASAYAASAGHVPPEAQMYGDVTPPDAAFSGLHGPSWFGNYDPTTTSSLPIVGHVAAPRLSAGQTYNYLVETAPCLEPTEADFTPIGGASGQTAAVDGVLATWSLSASLLTGRCADTSANRAFNYAGTYTVRVRTVVADNAGNPVAVSDPTGGAAAQLIGQDRRVLFLRHDANAHPGWPKFIGTSGEASPTMYDLEGRGELDVILPTSDGQILAFRPDGTPVPGWPVSVDPLGLPTTQSVGGQQPAGQIVGTVAIGDIDGDGRPEVVASQLKGGVYAWHADGTRVAGFPVKVPPPPNGPAFDPNNYCLTTKPHLVEPPPNDPSVFNAVDYGSISAPVLANLEGRTDGGTDIVQAAANGCVYALKPDGTEVSGWPVHPNSGTRNFLKIAATPAVGSLRGDGQLNVVVGTEEVTGALPNQAGRIYAYSSAGQLLPGWPVSPASIAAAGVPTVATGVISSPALVDVAHDGTLKVADGVFLGGTDASHPVNLYNADGTTFSTLKTTVQGAGGTETDPTNAFGFGITQTVAGTIGTALAVVTGGLSPALATDTAAAPGKKPQFQHLVGAWDASTGNPIGTFPRQIEDWQFLSGPVIADVKGDGSHQVITGSGGYMVHAFDPAATAPTISNMSTSLSSYMDYPEPAGFPLFTGGYITSTPAVGQLTRGGPVSLAVATRDGYLFMEDTAGQPTANDQWWHFHHDEWNTGRYGLDTRPPATVNDLAGVPVGNQARLTWTAPGDNWWVGTADHYELRCANAPLTYANFASAPQVTTGAPKASGSPETLLVNGLAAGPLYCGLRTYDNAGNRSQIAFNTTIAHPTLQSAVSTSQYQLTNSDGSTWQEIDPTNLRISASPTANQSALLGANADLFTGTTGFNQDLGIFVSDNNASDQLLAWKESGGSAGRYSPNAAYAQHLFSMTSGHNYVFKLKWKTSRNASGATIYAGAGPAGGPNWSPTSLVAETFPAGVTPNFVASTSQYTLSSSDGLTWQPIDDSRLTTTLNPATSGTAVLGANADLWTSTAGHNQDIGIFVSDNGGADAMVAWKESGGSPGTYSPNAAFIKATYAMTGGHSYTFKLRWKTSSASPGTTIWAAAGGGPAPFSPTSLFAQFIPGGANPYSSVSTSQYVLGGSDGATWQPVDPALDLTVTPLTPTNSLLGANADLFTAHAGYNQDLGIFVADNGNTDQLLAWKESGGAGTYSPNAAFAQVTHQLQAGHTYVFRLKWKTSVNAPTSPTVYVGAGPISGAYSPTRLTVELCN